MESTAAGDDISMNYQLGVDYYSSYFVSDKIHVGTNTTMTSTDIVSRKESLTAEASGT